MNTQHHDERDNPLTRALDTLSRIEPAPASTPACQICLTYIATYHPVVNNLILHLCAQCVAPLRAELKRYVRARQP